MASSTASASSPSPSPPPQSSNDIDTSGIPTLVSWDLADGTTEFLQAARGGSSSSLCHPKLHICYESASRSAVFKLQLSVLLQPWRSKYKNRAQFFLLIPPENIATMSAAVGGQDLPETVRKVLPADTVCLRFALTTPSTVVCPPGPDPLVPKNEHSAGILASLQDFAKQANIAIYFSHRVLDQSRLQALCTAASGCGLTSIKDHSTATLYGGKGGRKLEASTVAALSGNDVYEAAEAHVIDSPPSYDELGPGPPPAATASLEKGSSTSRKRPRRSSSKAGSSPPSPIYGVEGTTKKDREGQAALEACFQVDVMEKRIEQTQQMERRIEQMEQRLTARLDSRLDQFEKSVKEQLQEYKRSMTEMIDQRLDAHEEQTQADLDQLRREVDCDVEEQLIGKKAELDEQFRDEREGMQASLDERFAELEESFSGRFSSARAVLEFDW